MEVGVELAVGWKIGLTLGCEIQQGGCWQMLLLLPVPWLLLVMEGVLWDVLWGWMVEVLLEVLLLV